MKRITASLALCMCMLVSGFAPDANGQELKRFDNLISQGASHTIFARQGEATIQILVLGSVAAPGVYEVGVSVEMDQLLALAGGTPLTTTDGSESEITIRLFREEASLRELIYEASLEQMLAEPGLYPPLNDGDVFTVETIVSAGQRLNVLDIVNVLASITSIIVIFLR